jgi:hypothetical protein
MRFRKAVYQLLLDVWVDGDHLVKWPFKKLKAVAERKAI